MTDVWFRQWDDNIRHLAQRDGVVELWSADPPEGKVATTYKARVFRLEDDGSLLVEAPMHSDANRQLATRSHAEVLSVDGAQRVIGTCEVRGVSLFELNNKRKTRALRLGYPRSVRSAQRRRSFRADAVGADVAPVILRPRFEDGQQPQDTPDSVRCRMLNLGCGGVGLCADRTDRFTELLRATTTYTAELDLGDGEDRLVIETRLVHLHAMTPQTVYMGMKFQFRDAAEQYRVDERLQRVSAELQRAQLRRKRGA